MFPFLTKKKGYEKLWIGAQHWFSFSWKLVMLG
jgi:hypothetical protein